MSKTKIIIPFLILTAISCSNFSQKKNNPIKKNDIENKSTPFNLILQNNKVYVIGDELTYSYDFIISEKKNNDFSIDNEDINKVEKLVIKVDNYGNDISKRLAFCYNYPPQGITASSTIIENENKVWIHPPRQFFFKILELNPFPYIKKPIKIGKKWNWTLKIGEQYGDKRWKEWEKEITNISSYEIVKDTILLTKLGELHCYVTKSTAKSEIGQTHLTSFFNKLYGFVKLDYTNIDGSIIILELTKYKRMPKSFFKVGKINNN